MTRQKEGEKRPVFPEYDEEFIKFCLELDRHYMTIGSIPSKAYGKRGEAP